MQREGWLILKMAREKQDIRRWQLAQAIGSTESTIAKWETPPEKSGNRPDPDTVGAIEEALGVPGLWHDWMMATFDSYRKRHGERAQDQTLATSALRVRYEVSDVLNLQEKLERDVMDGRIDDNVLVQRYAKEAREAAAAMLAMADQIDKTQRRD